jgi:large subunit ribosomal protein L23
MNSTERIIRRPIFLTEKSNTLRGQNQVVFEVARTANKIQIKTAVQTLFNVKVESVNTMLYRGKDRRMGRGYAKMQNWKKAVVTLKEGENIDFFAETAEA